MALDADDGVSNTETLLPLSGSEGLIAEEKENNDIWLHKY